MTKKAAPAKKDRAPESRLSSGGIFDPEVTSPEKFDVGGLRVGGLVGLADCDMNRTAADRDSGAVLLWSPETLKHVRVPMDAIGIVTGIAPREVDGAAMGALVEVLWPIGPTVAFASRLVGRAARDPG
jgi:hypothetical protein